MPTITMRQFGNYGRFGNQIFEYMFLKVYARQHGCQLQLPSWVGNALFGCNDPPVRVNLPEYRELSTPPNYSHPQPPAGDALVNHDFVGYAQYQTSYFAPHWQFIRGLFRPTDKVLDRFMDVHANLRSLIVHADRTLHARTVVGVHLRRGDYGRQIFYITPVEWYLRKLEQLWPTLDDPMLFVATEDRSLVDQFSDYDPLTTDDLGVKLDETLMDHYPYLARDREVREPWQMDFFPDWYTLTKCDYLLMGNSTFPFTAAMMNENLVASWRSNLPSQDFVQVDPWNATPLTYDVAEDYKHVPGVCLESNSYW
jgi:hypothetical protein